MGQFKNEAVLHPLCIIHQTIREEFASRISKGKGILHTIIVACRSSKTGRVVFSKWGLKTANIKREEILRWIEGFACAFHMR